MFDLQVIVERAAREDAGSYECWDTKGEAVSKTKQVHNCRFIQYNTKVNYARINKVKVAVTGSGALPTSSISD